MRPGRKNDHIWDRVNWRNPVAIIARRLGCAPASVRYQRRKRNIPQVNPNGSGWSYRGRRYVEGPNPLPPTINL